MKLVGYQQPTFSVSMWNSLLETFSLSCELYRGAVFVHVRSAQLCRPTENCISFYMCRAL